MVSISVDFDVFEATPMPRVSSEFGPAHIVKKVKVEGGWNFFPAVVETVGKLKDKVRLRGLGRGSSGRQLLAPSRTPEPAHCCTRLLVAEA